MFLPRHVRFASLALGISVFLASGCDNEKGRKGAVADVSNEQDEGPVLTTCSSLECGPKPPGQTTVCPEGNLSGYVCRRIEGQCSWLFHPCAQLDAGSPGDAESHADADADAAEQVDAAPEDAEVAEAGSDSGPLVCNGRGGARCPAGSFCDLPLTAQCGNGDAPGLCKPFAVQCDETLDYVCGCDNRTYPNPCAAAMNGVSVKRLGFCSPDECLVSGQGAYAPRAVDGGVARCRDDEESWRLDSRPNPLCCLPPVYPVAEPCGLGVIAALCGAGQWCDFVDSTGNEMCAARLGPGTCKQVQLDCVRGGEYPVCGCQGRTYDSRCAAHQDGVSVSHDGACTEAECLAVAGARIALSIGAGAYCGEKEIDYGLVAMSGTQLEASRCCVPEPSRDTSVAEKP